MIFRIFLMLLCVQGSLVFGMDPQQLARTGSGNVPSVSATARTTVSQLARTTGHSLSTIANSATNAASDAVTQFKHTAGGAKSMIKDTADEAAKRGEEEARQKEEARKAQPTKLTIFELLQNQRMHATWNISPELRNGLCFDEAQAHKFAENFIAALRNDGNSPDQTITVGQVESQKVSVNLSGITKLLTEVITGHNQRSGNIRLVELRASLSQKDEELAEKNKQILTLQQSLESSSKPVNSPAAVASSSTSSTSSANNALVNQKRQFIKYGVFGGAGIFVGGVAGGIAFGRYVLPLLLKR